MSRMWKEIMEIKAEVWMMRLIKQEMQIQGVCGF